MTCHGSAPEPCTCSAASLSKAFVNVGKKAMPAVVFIEAETSPEEGSMNPHDAYADQFFRRFFHFQQPPEERAGRLAQGSGFVVTADGYIMTNSHVVKGASKITVFFDDGRELAATLVGADSHTEVAMIKIDGKDLPYVILGDSDAMEVGEWVIAIGSPLRLQATLTVGVVSAKGRQNLRITDLEDFIQTDAAINPGNSGGPLLNLNGEVIGINTAIATHTGGYMGIGFAVPSNMARGIMKQLIEKGSVTRGFLGVRLQGVDKEMAEAFNLEKAEGVLVVDVEKGSPADKAGLKQGDLIVSMNGTPIKSMGSFRNEISMKDPGSELKLKVLRKGETLTVPITLGSANDTVLASSFAQKVGLEVENLTPETAKQLGYPATEKGVVVTRVRPGSLASRAGLHPGFLIIEVNHKSIMNVDEFSAALGDEKSKKRVLLLVKGQNGMQRYYSLKVD
jgi:serine protease Do